MKKWILLYALIGFVIFPMTSNAVDIDGVANYNPNDYNHDPWEGGVVSLENNYVVNNNDISHNPIFGKSIDFKIVWETPEGITGQQMVQSIMSNSTIEIGDQVVPIDKNLLSYSDYTITYTFNKNGFDFWALLEWLASLVFNPELIIKTNIFLDVNTLSMNYSMDNSVGKIVTINKLPPSEEKELVFYSSFYNKKQEKILNTSMVLDTWNSYISPWNEQKAISKENGKLDDTQADGTTEVVGITRVLAGIDYRSRVVDIPITEKINPYDYMRVVNLYDKRDYKFSLQDDSSIISENFYTENNVPHLSRVINYSFWGNENQTPLSPVSMAFRQDTFLNMTLQSVPEQLQENTPFEILGTIESEGTEHSYYYKIDQGTKVTTKNKLKDKAVKINVEGLSVGNHQITVGVSNEFGLNKEESFQVNVINEQVKLSSVTEVINFGKHPIPHPNEQLFNENAFSIKVLDTYLTKKSWTLSAKIDREMQTETNFILPADLYIEGQNKKLIKLDKNFSPIFMNEEVNNGIAIPINFEPKQGLFLQMNSSNVKKNEQYNGSIQFVLNLGP